jgi:hypothetical protein
LLPARGCETGGIESSSLLLRILLVSCQDLVVKRLQGETASGKFLLGRNATTKAGIGKDSGHTGETGRFESGAGQRRKSPPDDICTDSVVVGAYSGWAHFLSVCFLAGLPFPGKNPLLFRYVLFGSLHFSQTKIISFRPFTGNKQK